MRLLQNLPDGVSELMCHPGYDGPGLAKSTYRRERPIEVELLTHPAVHQCVAQAGIELVRFGIFG
jgi:predicted glycoside hydrolase/deacetylase ChbG (UPF0249 family)